MNIALIALGLGKISAVIGTAALILRKANGGKHAALLTKIAWPSLGFAGIAFAIAMLTATSKDDRRRELKQAAETNTATWSKTPVVNDGVRLISSTFENDTLTTVAVLEYADPAVTDIPALKTQLLSRKLSLCADPNVLQVLRWGFSGAYVFRDAKGGEVASMKLVPGDCQ